MDQIGLHLAKDILFIYFIILDPIYAWSGGRRTCYHQIHWFFVCLVGSVLDAGHIGILAGAGYQNITVKGYPKVT